MQADSDAEWLEADGSGGFASGTVGGERTRRYHALLLCATRPPTARVVLVNGMDVSVSTAAGDLALGVQRYAPDVLTSRQCALVEFAPAPWPRWTFELPDESLIIQEAFVQPDACVTVLRWRSAGAAAARLGVRLFLSGRDYHALHHENGAFGFGAQVVGGNVAWRPYPDQPAIGALSNGTYLHEPEWYRRFLYTAERDRDLDCVEDLASPGVFHFDLAAAGGAVLVLRAGDGLSGDALGYADLLEATERSRRASRPDPLARSALSYGVHRDDGCSLIAGFPWFTDWGRDTFIAMRGLVLAVGDLATAERIPCAWAGAVSGGMLPNRFPDGGDAPEYNAVDASLWYVVAVHELLDASAAAGRPVAEATLQDACLAILQGYAAGARYGIVASPDGLLRAGEPGVQLTWMDAKTGDHVVTPRIGKPVEVQALWINALRIGALRWRPELAAAADRAQAAFLERFPVEGGGLLDVVDADHVAGTIDASVRPNQILAVGGLPFPVVGADAARRVVDEVEAKLLTPMGLRSLSPDDPAYVGRYRGGPAARDGAYHQGTVWPWLMGPFVDAWLTTRGRTKAAKAEAASRFLAPLMAHLGHAGLGHVSEVADGDRPHTPGGCPFQAWSLGELIRLRRMTAPG